MSNLNHPCEHWAESISLAAAGCLSSDEEQDVRRHIETCADCREQFQQLTELCRALSKSRLATDNTEAATVDRILSAVTADVSRHPTARSRKEMIHPTWLSRSLDIWGRITRSPVSRISGVASLALAIVGIAVWFHGGGTTPAFADFLEPILSAKTVTFKMKFEDEGQKVTGKLMATASPQRVRLEQDLPGNQKQVTISDDTSNLTLRPAEKLAIVTTFANFPEGKRPKAIFFELRSQLADARDQSSAWTREPLGSKVIDGRHLVGYRLTGHGMLYELWGDPKTRMPVRLESSASANRNMKPMIASDFVFDADLDESLFSLQPPTGYKVQNFLVADSPAKEEDLIETLRRHTQLNGGKFPDDLDVGAFIKLFQEDWAKSHPRNVDFPGEVETQEQMNGMLKFVAGLSFVFEQLPREADAHYAGKGVNAGTADTPVFWYRTSDAERYRIIYADFSVREAGQAPNVPNAQPVGIASEKNSP